MMALELLEAQALDTQPLVKGLEIPGVGVNASGAQISLDGEMSKVLPKLGFDGRGQGFTRFTDKFPLSKPLTHAEIAEAPNEL